MLWSGAFLRAALPTEASFAHTCWFTLVRPEELQFSVWPLQEPSLGAQGLHLASGSMLFAPRAASHSLSPRSDHLGKASGAPAAHRVGVPRWGCLCESLLGRHGGLLPIKIQVGWVPPGGRATSPLTLHLWCFSWGCPLCDRGSSWFVQVS